MDGVKRAQIIYNTCKDFILTDDQCCNVLRLMETAINKGLSPETNTLSDIKCRLTNINHQLNGEEHGRFIGIDLGLHQVSVVLIDNVDKEKEELNRRRKAMHREPLEEDEFKNFEITQMSFEIPKHMFTVHDGRKLFDFLVECLGKFVTKFGLCGQPLSIGLSFPFPMERKSLTVASLVAWTHHFQCEGVLGFDLAKQFRKAVKRHGALKVKFVVILDTIAAALIANMWKNRNCKISVIVENVCNASYVEFIENIMDIVELEEDISNTIINTEWGTFGENGALNSIRTELDKEMDKSTSNPDCHVYEKMISTVYLGELVRRILVNLMEAGVIFVDKYSEMLLKPWTFVHEDIYEIEADKPGKYEKCRRVLRRFELHCITDADCATVRFVCEIITTRSAQLLACGLVALLQRLEADQTHVIGIQGSLYRDHPRYAELVKKKIKKLIKDRYAYELFISPEVNGLGAALLAAIYHRIHFNIGEGEEQEYECSETEEEAISSGTMKIKCELEINLP